MATTRSALIIANNEYDDVGLKRLRAPAYDAESLGDVLRDPDIGAFEVKTLLNAPAHEASLAVEEFFADRAADDLLLMHVSSHGVKDEGGDLYFAASNTQVRRLGATAIAADFVNRCMARSRSRRIVLLLDCCYAGAFERGMLARAGSSVSIEEQLGGRGRAVITASSALEYAFEGGDLSDANDPTPSVFTSALVEGLRTGDADRDQDGSVALDELYEYVYDKVRAETPNQTPGKWVFGVQGDLVIARRARPVTSPAPLASELQEAVDSPFASVRLAVVSELGRLAVGRHEGRALAARLTLERLTLDDSRMVSEAAAATLAEQATAAPETEAAGASHARPADDGSVVAAPDTTAGPKSGPARTPDRPAATPRVTTAKAPTVVGPPDTAATPDGSRTIAAGADRPDAGSRFVVAGALTALGAVLWLAALFPPFVVDSGGTGYTIVDAAGAGYSVIMLAGLGAAAALLFVPAVRASIGAGFVIGVSTGMVSAVVLSALVPHEVSANNGSLGSAYYLDLVAALAVIAGAIVCASRVRQAGVRLQRLGRTSGWPAWTVAVLGVVAAASLLVQVVQASDLPGDLRQYDSAVDLPTLLTDAVMLAVVGYVAAASTPRRFGVAVLAGWLVAAASMAAYYLGGQLTLFTILLAAMAAVGVVFARDAKTTAPRAG